VFIAKAKNTDAAFVFFLRKLEPYEYCRPTVS